MVVVVTNAQRKVPVSTRRMMRLAQCAIRRLRVTGPGQFAVIFIGSQRMRTLNRRFLGHDRTTDVLSFRYDVAPRDVPAGLQERIVGEIFVAPSEARRYARRHGIPYEEELSRYVVHGLLHWLGHEDRTVAQQRKMRAREDQLLKRCSEL